MCVCVCVCCQQNVEGVVRNMCTRCQNQRGVLVCWCTRGLCSQSWRRAGSWGVRAPAATAPPRGRLLAATDVETCCQCTHTLQTCCQCTHTHKGPRAMSRTSSPPGTRARRRRAGTQRKVPASAPSAAQQTAAPAPACVRARACGWQRQAGSAIKDTRGDTASRTGRVSCACGAQCARAAQGHTHTHHTPQTC
jgi:hypothetical protein